MPVTEKQLGSRKKMIRKCRIEEEESAHIPPWIHSANLRPLKFSSLGPSRHPGDEARKGQKQASQ